MKHITKKNVALASLLGLSSLANAAITVGNVDWRDSVIVNPTSQSFYIDYYLFGSSQVKPNGFVEFYLTTDNGNTGFPLAGDVAEVNCGTGSSLCRPSPGPKNIKVTSANMDYNTRTMLNNLCAPKAYDVVATYNGSSSLSFGSALLGSSKRPDWLFVSGSMTPAITTTNGSVTIQYGVKTVCPSAGRPAVGVYLTDTNFNVLGHFGNVAVLSGNGSNHTLNLSFAGLGIPAGNYHIVLFADSTNMDAESSESNNYGSFALTLNNAISNKLNFADDAQTAVSFIDSTPQNNIELIINESDATRPQLKGLKILSEKDKKQLKIKHLQQLK